MGVLVSTSLVYLCQLAASLLSCLRCVVIVLVFFRCVVLSVVLPFLYGFLLLNFSQFQSVSSFYCRCLVALFDFSCWFVWSPWSTIPSCVAYRFQFCIIRVSRVVRFPYNFISQLCRIFFEFFVLGSSLFVEYIWYRDLLSYIVCFSFLWFSSFVGWKG